MFDLKALNAVFEQLEEERGLPRQKLIEAVEASLASAYKKEYGKKGQMIHASFNPEDGSTKFWQTKKIVDTSLVIMPEEDESTLSPEDIRPRFNSEHHITLEDAKFLKKDAQIDEEIIFPLEDKTDFGRIAAQTAKQVIIQKIRETERGIVMEQYAEQEGKIVTGTVERMDRGEIIVNLGRTLASLPYNEQIHSERFHQGDRIHAFLFRVNPDSRDSFLQLSRSHPKFLAALFEQEVPEIQAGSVEIKAIAREPGERSKIAVHTNDESIDPIGAMVGQRGTRVSTVMGELHGEKIDIIEWSEDPVQFIADSLSPAEVFDVELDETNKRAVVSVDASQQSLAIGKGGQNVRLAARLTGWKIDIKSSGGESASFNTASNEVNETKESSDNDIDSNKSDITENLENIGDTDAVEETDENASSDTIETEDEATTNTEE